MPRYLSWAKFFTNNWLVPLYPGTKYPIYSPRQPKGVAEPFEDPKNLHKHFPDERSYLNHRYDNERVLTCWVFRYNVGVLTGRQRDGRPLVVRDFDLYHNFGSTEAARKWRSEHISDLRELETRVTFSASGGLHIWFYAKSTYDVDVFLTEIGKKQGIDWLAFKKDVRANGGMIVVPPSKFEGHSYFFLDEGKQSIRELKSFPRPTKIYSPEEDLRELLKGKVKL